MAIPTEFPTPAQPGPGPAPVQLGQEVAPAAGVEGAGLVQEALRPEAGFGDTVRATANQWTTTNLLRAVFSPSFEPQEFDRAETIKYVPFALDEEERRLLNDANSPDEFWHRVGQFKERRDNLQAIGDNPITSFLTGFADPVWLGLTGGSVGVARTALNLGVRLPGRTVAAAVEAGGALGIGALERTENPVEWREVLLNAAAGGIATQLFYGPGGRPRPVDPDYPAGELRQHYNQMAHGPTTGPTYKWEQAKNADGSPVLSPSGKPVWTARKVDEVVDVSPKRLEQVQGVVREAEEAAKLHKGVVASRATTALETIAAKADEAVSAVSRYLLDKAGPSLDNLEVQRMSRADFAAKAQADGVGTVAVGYWSPRDGKVYLREDAPDFAVNHEIVHGLTQQRLAFGRTNPGTYTGHLYRELEGLRSRVEQAVRSGEVKVGPMGGYYLTNTDEFVAGLFSSDTQFLKALADMDSGRKNAPTGGMLRRLFDTVRRMLGMSVKDESVLARAMGLSDELLGTPNVRYNLDARQWENLPLKLATDKMDDAAKRLGQKFGWNLHKTLAGWNKDVADLLVSNPLDPAAASRSVEGMRRAIRADLADLQYQWERTLNDELASRGAGTFARTFRPKQAAQTQRQVLQEFAEEMYRREQISRTGAGPASTAPPAIQRMADAYDRLTKAALDEMKRAGVRGSEDLAPFSGYMTRRWDPAKLEQMNQRLQAYGLTPEQAQGRIVNMIAGAARRANGWDADLANDVARALYDRAVRKGNLTDTAFRTHVGNEAAAEVRDILKAAGVPAGRLERAMEVLTGVVDEAGKPAYLKHRVDLDLRSSITMPDGRAFRLIDLFDTDVPRLTNQYLDSVSSMSAFTRAGLGDISDIGKLRARLVESIEDFNQRKDAARLFDDTINYMRGLPAGDNVPTMMRQMAAVTQMVGLGSSGIWQITEYSTTLHRYGLTKTLRHFTKNMPGFRQAWDSLNKEQRIAKQVQSALTRNAAQDIRLRPFVNQLEDHFQITPDQVALQSLQNAKQWVPYLNGMKWVHHHQANLAASIIAEDFVSAIKGDVRALQMFQRYGLEAQSIEGLRPHLDRLDRPVGEWPDAVWDTLRAPLTTMIDEAALRSRVGEVPAFAQFSALGKFLFTFRSFILSAHNKILAGTMYNHGFAGLSLMMLYQFPLAAMAVIADNTAKGKEALSEGEVVTRALSQFGSLGLFTELVGVMSGEKNQFGTPGMIPVDRVYRLTSEALSGDAGGTFAAFMNAFPLMPVIPSIRAIGETLK